MSPPTDTRSIMLRLLLALVPAIVGLSFCYGWPVLHTLLWAIGSAVVVEAICLRLRRHPILPHLKDGSALVTAVLLALALPPGLPAWQIMLGSSLAMVFSKHLYGGLGHNPFNPAMVAYASLLIAFPLEMSQWPVAKPIIFFADATTQATPLAALRTANSLNLTINEYQMPIFWLNGLVLLGGLYLCFCRLVTWVIPCSVLLGVLIPAGLGYWINPSYGHPLLHLFSGATLMGAFFIATDPVTAATTRIGQLLYGLGIGSLTYLIRSFGHYPDGMAFAVLLMNTAAPTIDYVTRPRVYGYASAKRGWIKR